RPPTKLQMSERKMTPYQTDPLWNCTSSCPYFKYQTQCHDSILQQFYLFSTMDPSLKELQSHKQNSALQSPGLEPNFKEDPDSFTFHLSFTISNFSNKQRK
ncbi:hypothetical protein VP01_4401g1, partial [Puccinia sorghi]